VFNLLFEKFLPPGALWAIYQVSLYVLILWAGLLRSPSGDLWFIESNTWWL
jgi:hypothetical protein